MSDSRCGRNCRTTTARQLRSNRPVHRQRPGRRATGQTQWNGRCVTSKAPVDAQRTRTCGPLPHVHDVLARESHQSVVGHGVSVALPRGGEAQQQRVVRLETRGPQISCGALTDLRRSGKGCNVKGLITYPVWSGPKDVAMEDSRLEMVTRTLAREHAPKLDAHQRLREPLKRALTCAATFASIFNARATMGVPFPCAFTRL